MAWICVAKAGAVGEGEVLGVSVRGQELALYRLDGAYYATSNICTHQYALMSEGMFEDGCIECPLHQARFDVRTGAVLSRRPAREPLRTYPVKVEGDDLMVALDE